MLNEFAYCPRLCYIEWVQGEFLDSADTVDGRFQHRRVDAGSGGPSQDFETFHARSVYLTGAGITCRIDLLEGDGSRATPVDYKRGQAPDIPEGAYEPERVQLCAQGLVLRDNGFVCDQGVIYFVKSKKRVTIPFDEALVSRTRDLISALRAAAESSEMPPPLQHSPKCNRCSLAGICLPDEVTLLREMQADDERLVGAKEPDSDGAETEKNGPSGRIRRLLPSDDDAKPVYVVGRGNTVRKREERLEIWSQDGKVSEPKLREISMLSLYGGVEITTPAMVELMQRGVPVLHFTHGGWFQGICQGTTHKNVELRMLQFQCAADPKRSLFLARKVVAGKIKNCRTLLRRNNPEVGADSLALLAKLAEKAHEASASESLLGIEGAAAECYFSQFGGMLKEGGKDFSFLDRNRRPPKDPLNAVLSYLYGILVKDLFVTLLAVGFDPYLGFYHRPRYGRPALALDMMEEFRPLIADSVAINLFNNGEIAKGDFVKTRAGVSLSSGGKKAAVSGYERRMETEIIHPLFGYKVSYRRVLEVQSRLLARVVSGEIEQYPPFLTR
ncbi:MAG: CRISPR-associated endonuclease Cas1 [Methanosaeta sp. PtaU1.Bin112]|nr:MAG: CRISPR-associated endonuclease Cas1 [Methanosaeta sp. PtaU1.Bin112]